MCTFFYHALFYFVYSATVAKKTKKVSDHLSRSRSGSPIKSGSKLPSRRRRSRSRSPVKHIKQEGVASKHRSRSRSASPPKKAKRARDIPTTSGTAVTTAATKRSAGSRSASPASRPAKKAKSAKDATQAKAKLSRGEFEALLANADVHDMIMQNFDLKKIKKPAGKVAVPPKQTGADEEDDDEPDDDDEEER